MGTFIVQKKTHIICFLSRHSLFYIFLFLELNKFMTLLEFIEFICKFFSHIQNYFKDEIVKERKIDNFQEEKNKHIIHSLGHTIQPTYTIYTSLAYSNPLFRNNYYKSEMPLKCHPNKSMFCDRLTYFRTFK